MTQKFHPSKGEAMDFLSTSLVSLDSFLFHNLQKMYAAHTLINLPSKTVKS